MCKSRTSACQPANQFKSYKFSVQYDFRISLYLLHACMYACLYIVCTKRRTHWALHCRCICWLPFDRRGARKPFRKMQNVKWQMGCKNRQRPIVLSYVLYNSSLHVGSFLVTNPFVRLWTNIFCMLLSWCAILYFFNQWTAFSGKNDGKKESKMMIKKRQVATMRNLTGQSKNMFIC